jgi:endoglucanase
MTIGRIGWGSLILTLLTGGLAVPSRAADSDLRLNTIGFLPQGEKRASIAKQSSEFAVIRVSDGARVFAGRVSGPVVNGDTNEKLWTADFSSLREPGLYALDVRGVGRSAPFRVGADVYRLPFYTVMRGMYLWRCGTAVSGKQNGQTFAHGACHTNDAYLDFVGGGHVRKDGTRGWHDAGDYNKYVTNAGFTVGTMLQAWEQFKPTLSGVTLGIPESRNGAPDYLDEIRWELEWLLTMQMEDGRVFHKVSTRSFGGFVLPEAETAERYFAPWSSAATADFTAVMAMAARDFSAYDGTFARRCLDAAGKSFAYLTAHPEDHPAELRGFSTGGYQTGDGSRRLWAVAELWETTGDPAYLKEFERRAEASTPKVDRTCGWANVKNLGMYTYLLSRRKGKDPAVLDVARRELLSVADAIVRSRNSHGYGRPLGTVYYWGCNGDVAQQVETLQVAHRLTPKAEYLNTALDALGFLFGRNAYGRSFVTGLGHDPPMHPHDRRSGADAVVDPWPGYLVGGGWPKATDWVDRQESYQTNEIAINWNGALIYALAGFVAGKAH